MNVTIEVPVELVLQVIEVLSASLRPKPGYEPPMISVYCAGCGLLVETAGVPTDVASIFEAAKRIGWTVRGTRCFCPACA